MGRPAFIVPLEDTDLFRWCLAHGLRVFFVMNVTTIGVYQEPNGAYLPSVGYRSIGATAPARVTA
ncbi:MAG: hypothetical protein OEX05_00210 [Chloroflexota bacterium]|nr:hypothetical protein [Chloroflexota bacterium]